MSNSISQKSIYELTPQEKAKLLATVNTHRKERPLDWLTVAEILQHTPSNQELAKMLGASPRLIGMLKSLLSLPEEIKGYVRTKEIPSLDKAVQIARLKNLADQLFLAKVIVADPGTFAAPTVSKAVALRNGNKDLSIGECIARVLKSRPIRENRYILVTTIEKSLSENMSERLAKQRISFLNFLKNTVRQNLTNDKDLLSLVTHNGLILLTLTPEGWQALRRKSGDLGVPLDELIETLLRHALKAQPL